MEDRFFKNSKGKKENMFLIYVTFQDCVVNMSGRLGGRGDVPPTPCHLRQSGELAPSHED